MVNSSDIMMSVDGHGLYVKVLQYYTRTVCGTMHVLLPAPWQHSVTVSCMLRVVSAAKQHAQSPDAEVCRAIS
jgi:hypothetical protein